MAGKGNSHFSFKSFTIQQDKCAMKVCTDSCLFGAWVASKIEENTNSHFRIADVGAGTGILSLMLAQKSTAAIDAIELDPAASAQARENIAASPFQNIHVIDENVFNLTTLKYNCIISNPPFYEGQLQSPSPDINQARHESNFDLEEFAAWTATALEPGGKFYILLPANRTGYFNLLCTNNQLFCLEEVHVYTKQNGKHIRTMLEFGQDKKELKITDICIKDLANGYSGHFKDLLKDYYLQF